MTSHDRHDTASANPRPRLTPTRVSEGIWLIEGPIVSFYGFPYPTRCVVVRLGTGGLWIWSPIALSTELRKAVDALGPVEHLVSPNKLHHLALADWQRNYPDAALWGPRSTVRKRPDLSFSGVLEDAVPSAWANVIDQAWVRGSILLDEMVFFHRASRTVMLADLSEAFSAAFLRRHWSAWQRWIARLWGITEDAGKAPLEVRLSFIDRRGARTAVRRMLDWHPEKVIMAHGVWQRENGRAFLERAFSWLRVSPQAQHSGASNND